jgi:hypothetical protein
MVTLTSVKWLKRAVALTLLALWVPVTMHCALETLPAFGFLQWCCGEDESESQDHNCTDDSCKAVESGLYKIEDNPAFVPGLTAGLALVAWHWVAQQPPAEPALNIIPVSSAPPELARFWQFSCRTALPPRAPSVIA